MSSRCAVKVMYGFQGEHGLTDGEPGVSGGEERLQRAEVLGPGAAGTDLDQPPFIRTTAHCCNS